MAIKQYYTLDLVPNNVPVVVKCSQYDKQSRIFVFEMYKEGQLFNIPAGSSVRVRGTKSDNTGFDYACSYSGNQVSCTVEDQMTIFSGNVPCELRIAQGSQILGSANFILYVEQTTLADDITISESYLPLIEEAEQNALRAETAAIRAEGAVTEVESIVPSVLGSFVSQSDKNIDNYMTDDKCGVWYFVKNSSVTGTVPYASGQAILIVKKQAANIYRQVYIPVVGNTQNMKVRYYDVSAGTWSPWTNTSAKQFYEAGDTQTLNYFTAAGVVSGNRRMIRFIVPLPYKNSGATISISKLVGGLRAAVGGYIDEKQDSFDWLSDTTNYTTQIDWVSENVIQVVIRKPNAAFQIGGADIVNNTPIVGYLQLGFAFN